MKRKFKRELLRSRLPENLGKIIPLIKKNDPIVWNWLKSNNNNKRTLIAKYSQNLEILQFLRDDPHPMIRKQLIKRAYRNQLDQILFLEYFLGDPDIDARITKDAKLIFNKSLLLDKHYWELVKQIKTIQDFGKKKPLSNDEKEELFELKREKFFIKRAYGRAIAKVLIDIDMKSIENF